MKKTTPKKDKPVTLLYKYDADCEMEQLNVIDGNKTVCLSFGNYWDEHGKDRLEAAKILLKFMDVKFTVKTKRVKYDYGWADEK